MKRTLMLLVLVAHVAIAKPTDTRSIDDAIVSRDYNSAYSLMLQFRDSIDPIRGRPEEYKAADGYRDVIGYLKLIDLFESMANKFEQEKSDSQFEFAALKFEDINSRVLTNNYYVSADVIDIVNQRVKQASLRMEQLHGLEERYRIERATIDAAAADEKKHVEETELTKRKAEEDRRVLERQREVDAFRRQQQEQERLENIVVAKAEAELAARKKECGTDYGTPRIGMTLDRAQRCINRLHLVGQTNRADGVISQYRSSGLYVFVMADKVVSWDRY